MSVFYDKLDTTSNIVTATITLASLASAATVGRQSDAITIVDGSSRVPTLIEVDFWAKLAAGTPANDRAVYLFMARSVDEANFEPGPPAVGAVDAGFTFTNSPVGTSPLPTDLRLVGVLPFNASGEARRRRFLIHDVPAKLVMIVLNYSGIALTGTAGDHGIKIRKRWGEAA